MNEAARALPRQHTLEAWATAMQQQPRVWLPQEFPSRNVAWTVARAAAPTVAALWFTVVLGLDAAVVWAAVSALVIGALLGVAVYASERARRNRERCGWVVDFEQHALIPVGLPELSAIEVGPEYSLGCYGGSGDHEQGVSFQLELRHARKGPVAALTAIHMSRCGPAELRLLDQCVSHLTHRLGIRRSGAPLQTHFGLAQSDPAGP